MFLRLALLIGLAFGAPALAETPRLVVSLGQQSGPNDPELTVRLVDEPFFWKLQPMLGASVATNGSMYVGAGSAVTFRAEGSGAFLRASTMAGVYRRGSGKDLGGPIQFRSAIDFGITRPGGMEYGIGADHRSSARIYRPNPGLNTLYLFASIAR
ncbi:MAG: acyloxyacyl hydrolase [Roseinatronobacter sp.]